MAGDIQDYWSAEFPTLYDRPYTTLPADRIFAEGSDQAAATLPDCQGFSIPEKVWQDNAFYCFDDNFIVYDARPSGFIAQLQNDFGTLAIGAIFGHEWGHAVQDRAGNVDEPPIYQELQADCFAGAWVAHVKVSKPAGVAPDGVSSADLDALLPALLTLRDVPGSRAAAADAHGSGFDRISAFQDGFERGPSACVPYFDKPPVITELPFGRNEVKSGGNLAAGRVLPVSVDLLNDFYSKVDRRNYRPVPLGHVLSFEPGGKSPDSIHCGDEIVPDEVLTNDIVFCSAARTFILDTDYLQSVYEDIGDFGVMALVARPWAEYVQDLQGFPGAETQTDQASLAADCYTGGFAAAMSNGELESQTLEGVVEVSAGDLDEAIQAFIKAEEVRPGSITPFRRVEAFRQGFFKGYVSCDSISGASASP